MNNFIEIGHFYTDDDISMIDLSYLDDIMDTIKNSSNKVLALFIDNYNTVEHILDVPQLKLDYEGKLNTPIHIFYEGDMVQYYHKTLNFFTDKDLVVTKYNRGKKEKLELAIGDARITIAEISPNFKITCAMLSLMWTLYRLGVYNNDGILNNVTTIIDKKYMKVEEKVLMMLEYIQKNHDKHYMKSVDYWFYNT